MSGMSFEQVWRMTWPEYRAINSWWKKWPPAVVSLAALAKFMPQQRGELEEEPAVEEGYDASNVATLQALIDSQ